jgi:hypothetical protein
MADFPSLAWFENARGRANEDTAFRRLGTAAARFGVRVHPGDGAASDPPVANTPVAETAAAETAAGAVAVTLAAFGVDGVAAVDGVQAAELDFVLEMPAATWRAYLDGLAGTSPRQYLNDLDLVTEGGIVRGNARNRLLFPRYNATIERFFELGAAGPG